jgi:hypothetical protein
VTPERIALALVRDGYAVRKPPAAVRCWRSIELKAVPDGWGNLYVTTHGEIRRGYTRRASRQVDQSFRQRVIEGLECS